MNMTKKSTPIDAYARTNNVNTTGSYCGSIHEQLSEIGYWAKYNNCEIVREYKDECIPGLNKGRPKLDRLINDIEETKIQVKYVAVCQFNRVSRNAEVVSDFRTN